MADRGKFYSTSSYEQESAARKLAASDLKKLGTPEDKTPLDKKEGQNGRRRTGSIERKN